MKKLLALILCLSVALASFGTVAFAADDAAAENFVHSEQFISDYNEAKELLDMLYGAEVFADRGITRSEFVVTLFNLLKIDVIATGETFFKDVSKTSDIAPYVNTAVNLGWVSKADAFNPSKTITQNEALKILCCAMNYGFIAENKGGYPAGYTYVANKLDLIDNIEMSNPELDGKNAYVLLYNALIAPTLEQVGFGDSFDYDTTGKSLLYTAYDVYVIEGVVTRTHYNTLTGAEFEGIGNIIEIEGETYNGAMGCSTYDMLGTLCRAYVVENPAGKDTVIYLKDLSQKLEIKLIDIEKPNTTSIEYWTNDGNKKRTAKLVSGCLYILNGRKITKDIDKALGAGAGKITLVDNEDDGVYDVVVIERYSYIVVKSYDPVSGSLRDANSSDYTIDISDSICKVQNLDGDYVDVYDISEGNIYRVLRSQDGYYVELTQIEGEVTGYNNGIEGANIIIGKDYYIMSDYYKSISQSKVKDAVQYAFVVDNDVVIMATEDAAETLYGYAIGTDWTGGMETGLEMKVYTQNGKFVVYPVREKLMIDGENGKKDSDLHSLIGIKAQLVRFGVNSKGQINMVDTVSTEEPKSLGEFDDINNTLTKYEALSKLSLRYYSNPKTMGARYCVAGSVIFTIPEDLTDEEGFGVGGAQNLTNNEPYTFEVYDMTNTGEAKVLVAKTMFFAPHCDNASMVVKSVERAMDSEGNPIYKVYGFKGNTFTTVYLPMDLEIKKTLSAGDVVNSVHPVLSSGDMINYAVDSENVIRSAKVLFDAREDVFAVNTTNGAVSNPDTANTWSLLNGMVYDVTGSIISYSVVKDKNGNYDFSPENLRYASINTTNMCQYNCETTQIRNADASTVKTYKTDGDNAHFVAIQSNYYVPKMVTFYERTEVR